MDDKQKEAALQLMLKGQLQKAQRANEKLVIHEGGAVVIGSKNIGQVPATLLPFFNTALREAVGTTRTTIEANVFGQAVVIKCTSPSNKYRYELSLAGEPSGGEQGSG